MIGFYEVLDRAMSGRYCPEADFEMEVLAPRVRELISKYKIKYDPETPVPWDDDLADRVFQAGFELYRDVGTYCPSTERIMSFSEEELQEGLAHAPSTSVYGEGKDARTLIPRRPESDIPPFCFVGAVGAAVSNEELYASIMETYASFIPLADSITASSLASINGRTVRTGSPLEVLASIRAMVLGHEALRRGGRPGLPIMNCIATAASDVAKIAGSQFGVRLFDAWVIAHSAELKLEFQRLNEVVNATSLGGHIVATFAPMLDGYRAGPEGVAITNAAYLFSSILILRGSCVITFPMHFRYGSTTSREIIWAKSVSCQAMSRNSHFALSVDHYTAAGPMTDMFFYENAADILSTMASGSHNISPGIAKATHIDHFTPMEPRFSSEVAHATTGITRKDANGIVKKLLAKYEANLDNPPLGKKYEECWDIHRKTPSEDYVTFYKNIKKEISDLGIPF